MIDICKIHTRKNGQVNYLDKYCNKGDIQLAYEKTLIIQSVQFSCSVVSDSMPGLLVHRQLREFTQTHVHWVGGANQPSHPLLSPSPPAINLSQHQALFFFFFSGSFQMSQFFTSGSQSIGVSNSASVLPMNIQDWLPLGWTGWISLQSKGLSRVFSNTTVQKHQFFSP